MDMSFEERIRVNVLAYVLFVYEYMNIRTVVINLLKLLYQVEKNAIAT